MDFAKIKNLVKGNGDKVILLENGEPAMVVMSLSDYEKLLTLPLGKNGGASAPHEEALTLPSRRDEWQMPDAPETEFIADDSMPTTQPVTARAGRARLDEIRLEDLPL